MLVTHVQAVGPFLRIFGQLDLERMQQIQLAINKTINIINQIQTSPAPEIAELPMETICLARFLGKQYRRARIIGHWGHNGVFVQFIDYGNECNVKLQEIRLLNFETPEVDLLHSVPTQATPFILSGIYCQWTPHQMNELNADLGGQYVTTVTDAQLGEFIFISIIWRNENLVNYLVHIKNIGTMISFEEQTSIFNTILTTSRGLMPVRQLHGVLPAPQFNMVSILSSAIDASGEGNALYIQKPTISHAMATPVTLQTTIPPPMLPAAPTVIRMPYKNNVSAPNGRNDVGTLTSPPRKRNDITTIPSPPKRSVLTFKSNTLMVGKYYDVYCCFVENGPCLFTVHLKSTTDELNEMMNDVDSLPLSNLTERPSIGMACIAKYSEDNHLYRAVIMTIKPTACQVAYVDYGNTETVPFADIYEIPPSLLDQKIFAIRFALSGYKELEPLDEVLKNAFKDMVLHKDLRLKVMPLEGPPLVQYCELFDGNTNILDALKMYKNRQLSYSQPPPLCNNDLVVIRYVESPKKFFVQKVDSISAFDQMMDDLFLHCKKTHSPLQKYAKGAACAVKFENAWYRAEIMSVNENRIHIRHVDFGNERYVDCGQLCAISERLVKFPIQASKCCLKGFEKTESLSESATVQLEMLAENANNERRHFKCQIYQIEKDETFLVNLIDDKMRPELNLMKRLYKLSMPFNKYIGLEKEEYPYQENAQPVQAYTDYIVEPHGFNSSVVNQEDQRNANEGSGDLNVHSTNSVHSDDSKDCSNSSEQGGRIQQNNHSPGSQRPFRENNNRREQKEQPYKTFRGKNTDLPPRFQKNQDENRRYKENRGSGAYEQKRNNYNSEGYNSSPSNAAQQLISQPVQCDDDWETNASSATPVSLPSQNSASLSSSHEEYVPSNFQYSSSDLLVPWREEIILCWWVSPHQFYTHNCESVSKFDILMRDIQLFYKNKSPATNRSFEIGSSVVVRYQKDKVLYRATILAHNESLRKYRVELVDFGNLATVTADDIWLLEKRFSEFPIMANLCGFENIVSNMEHREITSQVEKYLKPGRKLYCNYLRRENKMYFADIDVNGESLKDLLIKDGALSIVEPNLNLEMLSGQKIQIKIVNVKDLLNFQIEIEGCDLRLMSSYNDIKFVKSNPHLSTEFAKNYEGKYCIADVINVSKEKILMLQPIIPLFNNHITQRICEYPIVYREFNVKVAFIETENTIYVHPIIIKNQLDDLLDSMFQYYSSQGSPMLDYLPGTLCAALSADGNWYRAKIVFVDSSQPSVEVYYLDYGNIELIEDMDNIRILASQFYEYSAFAIRVIFPIKCNNNDETAIDTIKSLTDGYELTLSILERYKNGWIADLQSNGHSLISVLKDSYSLTNGIEIEHAKNIIDNDVSPMDIVPSSPDLTTKTQIFEPPQVTASSYDVQVVHSDSGIVISEKSEEPLEAATDMIPAYLSHCDNPGRFFLHLTSNFHELQQLQDNIQIVAGSLPPLMTSVTGALCIALYTVDETWYRAKIIDNEIMAVQFIDYGNTDVLTDSSYVKEMNEAFANIPPFAISCALPISPRNTADWVDEANSIFNEAYDKTVHFSYVTQNLKKNYVNLKIDGLDVAKKLIADGLARKLEVLKSGENGFVSHINSLSDFYIQMESYADGLELIAGHLADFENFQVLTDFSVGNICAAVFPDDGSWYRAKILSHTSEGTEVLFIDFGNTAVTTELREISAEIANLPFLSKKCSLRMPDYILGWSDEAEAKLHELSAMGETVFIVELIEPSDHAIIDLFIGNRNILEDLEPLCDKRPNIEMDLNSSMGKDDFALHDHISEPKIDEVGISHVNSPSDFYIQLFSEKDQLDEVLNVLNGEQLGEVLVMPAVGTICNAVFSDDGAYYRAKVLSNDPDNSCCVLFIDYGNTAVSNEFYALPKEWSTRPPLAHQCTLDQNGPLDLNSQSTIDNFLQIIAANEEGLFKVDVIDRSTIPWKVTLQSGEVNVYDELERLQPQETTASRASVANAIVNKIIETSISNAESMQVGTENIVKDLVNEIIDESIPVEELDGVCEKVIVSHVNSPTDFYIQLLSEKDILDYVLETVNSAELSSVLEEPQVGMMCNALFNDDETFYRAEIVSSDDNGTYRVLFIDYGNETTTAELYSLPASVSTLPPLAYHCTLHASDSLNLKEQSVIDDFHQLISECQIANELFDATVANRSTKPWIISLTCYGKEIIQELTNRSTKRSNTEFSEEVVDSIIEKSMNSVNSVETVSTRRSNTEFSEEVVDSIIEKSMNSVNSVETVSMRRSNTEFSEQVVDNIIDNCMNSINSVETGQEQQDQTQFSNQIVDDIIENSMNCAKSEKTIVNDIVSEIIDNAFATSEGRKNLQLQNKIVDDINGIEASNEICFEVIITQVYNKTDFYIRPCSVEQKLKEIEIVLKGATEFEALDDPRVGKICAAAGMDHKVYQRAKLLAIEDDGRYYVELIDSGVRLHTADLRKIGEDLQKLPGLAKHCSLVIEDEVNSEEPNVFKRFYESNSKTQYTMEVIKSCGDIDIVRLSLHGVPIQEKLKISSTISAIIDDSLEQIYKDAVVSHINSPDDFYIQLTCDAKHLDSITEALYDASDFDKVSTPEVGMLCAALFPDDGAFYRGQIINIFDHSSYEVRFIDFGNISVTEDIRQLPEDLCKKDCVAKQCALQNLKDVDLWSELATDSFKALITSHFGETFQVDIKSKCQTPWIVSLSYNSLDLVDELYKLIEEQRSGESSGSSDVWAEAKDSSGAIICSEIVDDMVDEFCETNGNQSNCNDSSQDTVNLNDSNSTSSEVTDKNPITCEELAQQLWDGLQKLGITDSGIHSLSNRASSTSNLCDKNLKYSKSVTDLPTEQSDPTRSKSVECVIDSN